MVEMPIAPSRAEHHGVLIIDGMPNDQRMQYQDSAKLEALIARLAPGLPVVLKECNDKQCYFEVLEWLADEARQGRTYFVHYECHGSIDDGIRMGADDVSWIEQARRLSDVNAAMNQALSLDLSACNGIYAAAMTIFTQHAPFYAIIAPAMTIHLPCAATITAAFWEAYLTDPRGLVQDAVAAANRKLGMHTLEALRAEYAKDQRQKGYQFRPNAEDDQWMIKCRGDGTVYRERRP